MLESFGARMRRRREEQGIALAVIAGQTKIKLSLLEALERDDLSHWPSGIYRRSYIRAYAQAIGLHPDVVVREFLEVHPEPVDIAAAAAIAAAVECARTNAPPPTRLRNIMGSALGSLARLRRSSGAEDPAGADVESFPGTAPGSFELGPDGETDEAAAECVTPDATDSPELSDPGSVAIADTRPLTDAQPSDLDFTAVAHVCTELGRAGSATDVQGLLQEAARIFDATGLIVWIWDASSEGLRPAVAHGYPDRLLAQLPVVARNADNATAAAFRSSQTCAIQGSDHVNGALVVPLLTPDGCAGVLAIELQHGRAHTGSLQAAATILAALLGQLAGSARADEGQGPSEATLPPVDEFTDPVARTSAGRIRALSF